MKGGIVAKRYAKALLNLTGRDQIEKIGREIQEIAELFEENSNVRNLMFEPKLSKTKKIAFIGEVAGQMKCDKLVNKYCRYLTSRNRFGIITDISKAYNELASEKLGTASAKVTVAGELSPDHKTMLSKNLSDYLGKKVTVSVNVDKSIIGGAIASIESLVLDGSVRNKLNLIRETISKGN